MFTYTLDNKEEVTDVRGNRIKDLTKSIFSRSSGRITDYEITKATELYHMRPDLVSQAMYDTDEYTEFVLKFSGISNPFTLNDDDTLLIPSENQAKGMMAYNNQDEDELSGDGVVAQIRNFYKFVNTEYKSNRKSYDDLANKDIPDGRIDADAIKRKDYIVPYISEDGRTSITIRGNRIYFGEDSGLESANNVQTPTNPGVEKSVQSILAQAQTELSNTNCLYNGQSTTDFFRANANK